MASIDCIILPRASSPKAVVKSLSALQDFPGIAFWQRKIKWFCPLKMVAGKLYAPRADGGVKLQYIWKETLGRAFAVANRKQMAKIQMILK